MADITSSSLQYIHQPDFCIQAADRADVNRPKEQSAKTEIHWFQIGAFDFRESSLLGNIRGVQVSDEWKCLFFQQLNNLLLDSQEQIRTLSLEKQLENLKAKYAEPGLLTHPLLPPYKPLQLLAIEADLGIRFPAILRSYLLHISRQQAITNQRSCVGFENVQLDSFSAELSLELANSNRRQWEGKCLLTLKGFHRGFVSMLFAHYKWKSVYHCMMQPAARDEDFVADWYQQLQSKRAHALAGAEDRVSV